MLSIGVAELVVVAAVLLLVVGPEQLPRLMRTLGRTYGQLRRSADDLRRAFVLEADRQDAEERLKELRERRRQAAEARQKAMEQAGEGTVAQREVAPEAQAMASEAVPVTNTPEERP